MLLICPQLALAMPSPQSRPAAVVTAPTPAPTPAAPRTYVWHGMLALIMPAVMWLLGTEGKLPLNF